MAIRYQKIELFFLFIAGFLLLASTVVPHTHHNWHYVTEEYQIENSGCNGRKDTSGNSNEENYPCCIQEFILQSQSRLSFIEKITENEILISFNSVLTSHWFATDMVEQYYTFANIFWCLWQNNFNLPTFGLRGPPQA